jgi:hypothetical protein
VELRGEYVEQIYLFNPIDFYFLYTAKELSAPLVVKEKKKTEDIFKQAAAVRT